SSSSQPLGGEASRSHHPYAREPSASALPPSRSKARVPCGPEMSHLGNLRAHPSVELRHIDELPRKELVQHELEAPGLFSLDGLRQPGERAKHSRATCSVVARKMLHRLADITDATGL